MYDDAKVVRAFDFRVKTRILYRACCLIRCDKAHTDADFQEWRQFKVKADRKKTTSVFGFWLTVGENIDFATQYLATYRLFGDALVDFS